MRGVEEGEGGGVGVVRGTQKVENYAGGALCVLLTVHQLTLLRIVCRVEGRRDGGLGGREQREVVKDGMLIAVLEKKDCLETFMSFTWS